MRAYDFNNEDEYDEEDNDYDEEVPFWEDFWNRTIFFLHLISQFVLILLAISATVLIWKLIKNF